MTIYKTYIVSDAKTGAFLLEIKSTDVPGALDAIARDFGYDSFRSFAVAAGIKEDDLHIVDKETVDVS